MSSEWCGGDGGFEQVALDLNYILPFGRDRFLARGGVQVGELGARPYLAASWVAGGILVFGWTLRLSVGPDFVELGAQLSPFGFALPF